MHIALSKAKARLCELAARAEQGEEMVLTRRGHPAIRLVAEKRQPTSDEKWAMLERLHGAAKNDPAFHAMSAADADKFLYDDDGLPA